MSETDGTSLHLLAGDAYPKLLDGWCGPLEVAEGGGWRDAVRELSGGIHAYSRTHGWYVTSGTPTRIDARRPECIDRVIRVLRVGVQCDVCDGTVVRLTSLPSDDQRVVTHKCAACNGTGYRIAPADLGWARDLPAWQAGPILAASVLRVVAGEAAIDGLLAQHGMWDDHYVTRATVRSGHMALRKDSPTCAGFAIHNTDHILIPLTGGKVARVEAP